MDHAAGIPNYAFNVSLFRLEFRTWIFLPARDSESLNTPNELTRARGQFTDIGASPVIFLPFVAPRRRAGASVQIRARE